MSSANSLWEWIYVRPYIWVVNIQAVVYVVLLAILEAETEASRIAAFAGAIVNALLVLWYTYYLGWRLWAGPASQQAASYLPLSVARPVRPRWRDQHSIAAYIDLLFAMVLTWAMLSQTSYLLFPHEHLFELSDGASHNRWANAVEWISSIMETFHTSGTPYSPAHPGTKALYTLLWAVQYVYDRIVFVVGVAYVFDRLREAYGKEEHQEASAAAAMSHTAAAQAPLNWHEAVALPPPNAPIGNDVFGFHQYLQQQRAQQQPPAKEPQPVWLAAAPPAARVSNAYAHPSAAVQQWAVQTT